MTAQTTREALAAEIERFFQVEEVSTENPTMQRVAVSWLKQAVAALRQHAEPDWQPIETAPKDGTEVLLWNGRRQHTAKWDRVEGEWVVLFSTVTRRIKVDGPTHWRPLPTPPLTCRSSGDLSKDRADVSSGSTDAAGIPRPEDVR